MPWALAIAKRLMIDRARRRRVELGLFSLAAPDDDSKAMSEPTSTATAEDVLDARRMERRIRQRLEALPEIQRTAYRLVKEEGLSLKRAAELLGTSVAAVKLRTHRVYRALRAVLREERAAA